MNLVRNSPIRRHLRKPVVWAPQVQVNERTPTGNILDAVCPHCDQRGFDCTRLTEGRVVPVCLHCGQVGDE